MTPHFLHATALTLGTLFATSAALAEPAGFPFTYEMFEHSVSHLDLEACPDSLPQKDTFCRAAIQNEQFHVFAFSYEGDSPMVGFATFEAEGLDTLLK